MSSIDDSFPPVETESTATDFRRFVPPVVARPQLIPATAGRVAQAIGNATADFIMVSPDGSLNADDLNAVSGTVGTNLVFPPVLMRLKHALPNEDPTTPPSIDYLVRGIGVVMVDIRSENPGRNIGLLARELLRDLNLSVELVTELNANAVLMNYLLKWGIPQHMALKLSMLEM